MWPAVPRRLKCGQRGLPRARGDVHRMRENGCARCRCPGCGVDPELQTCSRFPAGPLPCFHLAPSVHHQGVMGDLELLEASQKPKGCPTRRASTSRQTSLPGGGTSARSALAAVVGEARTARKCGPRADSITSTASMELATAPTRVNLLVRTKHRHRGRHIDRTPPRRSCSRLCPC